MGQLSRFLILLAAHIVKKTLRVSLWQIAVPEIFRPFLCSTKPSEIRVILWGYTRKIMFFFYSSYLEQWRSKFILRQRGKWSEQGLEGAVLVLMVLWMLSYRGPARYCQPLIDMVSSANSLMDFNLKWLSTAATEFFNDGLLYKVNTS